MSKPIPRSQRQAAPGRPLCEQDRRRFEPQETLEVLAQYADDPFVVINVIRPLAEEYGLKPYLHICPECVRRLIDRAREAVQVQPIHGKYYDRDDIDLGREDDLSPLTTYLGNRGRKETVSKKTDAGEIVETDEAQVEAAPVEKTPSLTEQLQDQFQEGTLVRLTKTDWKGSEGIVLGVEQRRGAPYINIQLLTFANGRRREEAKQVVQLVRYTSLEIIAELSPEPVKVEPVVESPADAGSNEPTDEPIDENVA